MSSRSLLLIDTDPAVHELLGGMLQREDRQIQAAHDGREALNFLRKSPFDVVIAGQSRNGFDGLKLIRRVRALRPEARVIVTGDPDPQRVLAAVRQRAYSYVHQPLSSGHISEIVAQAFDSSGGQDDIRLVSARPEWISFDVRCRLDAAERTTQFFRELSCDLEQQLRDDITAAFRELIMNAIEHGGRSDPRKRVRASLIRTHRAVIVHIHDPGKGFSLETLPHAAISNPEGSPIKHVEIRAETGKRPGGFGILMTRNLVDELLYNERGNSVLFVKYL